MGSGVVPSWVPAVLRVVEGVAGVGVSVGPRLVATAIGEITSSTTYCNVENQVKVLVERGVLGLVDPRVVLAGPSTFAEEVIVGHVNVEDDVFRAVDVGCESFRGPEEAVDVHLIGKRAGVLVVSVAQVPSVLVPVGTPVESRSEGVMTTESAVDSIATGLHNIDFTGGGPGAECVVSWEHPDGRPNPISLGELGGDLNSTVGEVE